MTQIRGGRARIISFLRDLRVSLLRRGLNEGFASEMVDVVKR